MVTPTHDKSNQHLMNMELSGHLAKLLALHNSWFDINWELIEPLFSLWGWLWYGKNDGLTFYEENFDHVFCVIKFETTGTFWTCHKHKPLRSGDNPEPGVKIHEHRHSTCCCLKTAVMNQFLSHLKTLPLCSLAAISFSSRNCLVRLP